MTEAAMDVDGGDAPQRQKASAVDANDAKKNQMWVEKYRPSKLSDVAAHKDIIDTIGCLLYTSPSPRDQRGSRMPSSA